MVTKHPNENIIKLRELSNILCTIIDDKTSEKMIYEIKNIVEVENEHVNQLDNKDAKIMCYENMCTKLKIILNKFKFV